MSDTPLLIKPEPILYIPIQEEVKFSQKTHDRIMSYLGWNYSLDENNDLNYFLDAAVNNFLNQDKVFKKHYDKKLKVSSKRKSPSINKNEIKEEINSGSVLENSFS